MSQDVAIFYDGSRGDELRVTLRDRSRAARFSREDPMKVLPEGDAQDLLNPQLAGGAFCRAVPLADVRGGKTLEKLVKAGEVTTHAYLPKDAVGDPVVHLVMDPRTVKRLRKPAAAEPEGGGEK